MNSSASIINVLSITYYILSEVEINNQNSFTNTLGVDGHTDNNISKIIFQIPLHLQGRDF